MYEHYFGNIEDYTPDEIVVVDEASDDDLRALSIAGMLSEPLAPGTVPLFDERTVASLYREYAALYGEAGGSEMAMVFQFEGHRFSFDEFVNKLVPTFTDAVGSAWSEFPFTGVFDVTANVFDPDSINFDSALTTLGADDDSTETSVPSNIYLHLVFTGLPHDEFLVNEFIEDFLTAVESTMVTKIAEEHLETHGSTDGVEDSPFIWVVCERVQRRS